MNTHYRGDAFLIVHGASGLRQPAAKRQVLVFQCYLDDSGTSGLPVVTMAGFVSSLGHWKQIEPIADEVLNRYGVPVFHAKEFHSTKGVFENWTRLKKRSLAKELFSPLKGRMYAVSSTVHKAEFYEAKKRTGSMDTMSPYGVCFSSIVTRILMEPQMGQWVRQHGLAFLVESGNINNAEIENHFHFMSKQKVFAGYLRSISFISKESCRAIQLADYWAFYSRRMMRDTARFGGKVALPTNYYYQTIRRNFPVWEKGLLDFSAKVAEHIGDFDNFDDLLAFAKGAATQRK